MLPPRKSANFPSKGTILKGNPSSNHQFSGHMLVFRGVSVHFQNDRFRGTQRSNSYRWPTVEDPKALHPDVHTLRDGSELWLVYKLKSERTVPTVEKKSDILLLPVRLNSIYPWFFFPKKCLFTLNDVFLLRKLTVCFNKLLQRLGDWQDHVPTWKVEIVPSPIGVSGARSPGGPSMPRRSVFFLRWERC